LPFEQVKLARIKYTDPGFFSPFDPPRDQSRDMAMEKSMLKAFVTPS
jgi:hypothetical protein